MSKIKFNFSWLDTSNHPLKEYGVTSARFQLEIGDNIVTFVNDNHSRSSRPEIYIPLYPLAEWIVSNWWFMFYEYYCGQSNFERRHNIAFADSGIVFPELILSPEGKLIRFIWKKKKLNLSEIDFIESGEETISWEEVYSEFNNFIEAVIERLNNYSIANTQLQEQWDIIKSSTNEERDFCIASASLGLNPYDTDETISEAIIEISNILPDNVLTDFFQTRYSNLDPKNLLEEAEVINKIIKKNISLDVEVKQFVKLRKEAQESKFSNINVSPWDFGYTAARQLRKHLGLNGKPISDFNYLAKCFKIKSSEFESIISETSDYKGFHPNQEMKGLVTLNKAKTPEFALFNRNERSRRFTLCRGIFEYLFSNEQSYLITTIKNQHQKTSKAFAAEFLAPSEHLRTLVTGDVISYDEVEEIAEKLNISTMTIQHQIENHGIATII